MKVEDGMVHERRKVYAYVITARKIAIQEDANAENVVPPCRFLGYKLPKKDATTGLEKELNDTA